MELSLKPTTGIKGGVGKKVITEGKVGA